eukprot:m.78481 g.78481  ORF g.78481 m.78481 type:complete len:408 (-) comp14749_c0_seq1:276-1499(-)
MSNERTRLLPPQRHASLGGFPPLTQQMTYPLERDVFDNSDTPEINPAYPTGASPGSPMPFAVGSAPSSNQVHVRTKKAAKHHQPLQAAAGHMPTAAGRRRRNKQTSQVAEAVSDNEDDYRHPIIPRRVYTICIAQELDMQAVVKALDGTSARWQTFNEEVIHVRLSSWSLTSDAYILPTYGSVVLWNVPPGTEALLLDLLRQTSGQLFEAPPGDTFDYYYLSPDATTESQAGHLQFRIEGNTLVLPHDSQERDVQHRLAASYGLATSVKLDSFELAISRTIEITSHIPEDLARDGVIRLTKREVSQYIGELYIQKASVNLMFDILDAPDFFWNEDDLGLIYNKCRKMLDIDQRVEVLNRRLDVLAELLAILREEKSEQNSHRLEIIVIFLIIVEILLGVSQIIVSYV